MPFFRGSSWPRDWTHVSCSSCIAGELFTTEPPGKPAFLFVVVVQSCQTLCDPMACSMPGFPVLHHLPELTQTLVDWLNDAIQLPFSSCLQSFPASVSFLMSQLFASGDQSIGALASAAVFSMSIQGWFPLGLTGLISLQFKGLSKVLSSTTVWKHWFFGSPSSLWSHSHIHTRLLEKP